MAHANTTRSVRQNRKKKRSWLKIISLLFVLAAFAGALFASSGFFDNPKSTATEGMLVAKDKATIMIMGVDERDDDVGRSDTLMVATIDPKKDQAALLSIPRDTRVKIKGHGFDKINAAYAYGGAVMAKQTVANLLRVPIHYYALANWRGFIDVVNLIGGVDIYVDKDMYYEDPYADLVIDIKHGYQHMDGETAGKYVRFRKDELGDIGRVQRQQKFLKAAAEQMFSVQNVAKISNLLATLDKYVETDLNTLTMLKAANSFKLFGDDKLRSCMLYGKFDDSSGVSYWNAEQADVNKSLDELGIPYLKDEEDTATEAEEEPKEHLQPKDRDELEKEAKFAEKASNN